MSTKQTPSESGSDATPSNTHNAPLDTDDLEPEITNGSETDVMSTDDPLERLFDDETKLEDFEVDKWNTLIERELCPEDLVVPVLRQIIKKLYIKYEEVYSLKDLNTVIVLARRLIPKESLDDEEHAATLTYLANALQIRSRRLGKKEDLDEAIELQQEARSSYPPGHPNRSASLNNLANSLQTRYERLGDRKDLDDAIELTRESLSLRPPGHPSRSMSLNNLASSLKTRYRQWGEGKDLDEAVELHLESLSLRPLGHPDRSMSLNNLANTLQIQYQRLSKWKDLDDSVKLYQEALLLHPLGHPDRALSLNNVANSLMFRYERSSQVEDLNGGLELHREAVSLHPPGHPDRSMSLNNLANSLQTRYERLGEQKDLDDAVDLHREALLLRPRGHIDRSVSLNNLATSLRDRYNLLSEIKDLNEAVELHLEALSLRPPGHPDSSTSLSNLASSLETRYKQLGERKDHDEAVARHRAALLLRPPGHLDRSMSLNNLANSLQTRYKRLGERMDIDEAVKLHREALFLRPPGHLYRHLLLNNLSNSLQARYEQLGERKDLDDAIELSEESLSLRPPGHPERSGALNNLAMALQTRYEESGEGKDLDKAVELQQEALTLYPPGHSEGFALFTNLATSLTTRYERTSEGEDIDAAVELLQKALSLSSPGHPDRASLLHLFARCIELIHLKDTEGNKALQHSVGIVDMQATALEAVQDSFSSIAARLSMAQQWARAKLVSGDFRMSMHTHALLLLQQRLMINPDIYSTQEKLSDESVRFLTVDAAAAAIGIEELEKAIEFLDMGRSMFLATLQRYRSPLDNLREVNRKLADQFSAVSSELERLAVTRHSPIDTLTVEHSLDFALAVQRKLVQQWESFLSDIRKIDGFEDFLGIPSYGKLQVAARGGPIIFLNANKTRCDAIIMPPSGSPHLIPLEGISLKQLVEEHVAPLYDALEKGRFAKMKTIFSLLQFLWRALVYPITKALTFLGIAYGSRIWWCPSSAFTMLPIHAAGLYNGTSHSNLPDLFISSYISTASNLLRASSLTEVQYTAPNSRLLFVGHSAAGDLNINNELCQIQSVLPTNVKPLVEKKATPTTVTEDMAKFPWIHFSCHGNVVSNKPLDSCFHLEGGRLRVQDIIAANLPHAELAFLSACHSAAGGTILPDESMHLTSALQFAGFRSAVGTLWEMYDGEAPRLAKHFYSKLIELGGRYSDAAEALNFAIKKLRRRKDATPDRWAMFVHIGA